AVSSTGNVLLDTLRSEGQFNARLLQSAPVAGHPGTSILTSCIGTAQDCSASSIVKCKGDLGMRVLVTGHKGYIGTVMTPMLLNAGHEVVGYDSDLYRRCTYPVGGEIADAPMIKKDTRDIDAADLKGFDAVVFLAALSNDPLGNLNPSMTF